MFWGQKAFGIISPFLSFASHADPSTHSHSGTSGRIGAKVNLMKLLQCHILSYSDKLSHVLFIAALIVFDESYQENVQNIS